MSGRIYPEEQFEHDFEHEPDWDDVNSMMADEEDNAPPSEPFYAFEEDETIYDDDDDLCPDCGEPSDFCVCNTDDELDEFDATLDAWDRGET